MMLVLRAWLTAAQWNILFDKKRSHRSRGEKGRLSVTAVAEHANGKQLAEILQEGLTAEVLSWKMDVEEPKAASLISQALNKGHQLALRTTELTAMKLLMGEIIVQQSKDVGQRVAFQTVRDALRNELESMCEPRFNCELQMKTLSCVCIATAKDTCLNRTRIIEAPFLVNSTALEKGEELILEIAEVKAKKDNTKRTWKDAMKEEDKQAKKQRGKRETKNAESNFD